MDFNLKQWRNQQHESEQQQQQQPAVKMPKLLLDSNYSESALPLFVPEQPTCKISNLSAFSDSTLLPESPCSNSSTRSFHKMGGGSCFSWAQRQELELQALIFKYMTHGVVVPQELLLPIKKSLLQSSSPFFLHHPIQHYSYYQPALLQAGYWGRAAMDPEPGRCRRTDGKKWRCSRDVVAGQKYCERHVHRGRNRSRKPVEIPTPSSSTAVALSSVTGSSVLGGGGSAYNTASPILAPPLATLNNNTFCFTGQSSSSAQFIHHNNGASDSKGGNGNDGRILRHFFDDWPKSESVDSQMNSATCLSISMPGIPTSDISLKLAVAGGGGEGVGGGGGERELLQPSLNWNGGGWGAGQVGSMGGPLAEALRSSSATTNSSPTSVLHHLPRASASETTFATA